MTCACFCTQVNDIVYMTARRSSPRRHHHRGGGDDRDNRCAGVFDFALAPGGVLRCAAVTFAALRIYNPLPAADDQTCRGSPGGFPRWHYHLASRHGFPTSLLAVSPVAERGRLACQNIDVKSPKT